MQSWTTMIEGPDTILTRHNAECGPCTRGDWATCLGREAILEMTTAKVLWWQEDCFAAQGWEIDFHER